MRHDFCCAFHRVPGATEVLGSSMNDNLPTYLNDHLIGARFAIEMLERLRDSTKNDSFARHLAELLEQIEEDRDVLQGLVEKIGQKRNVLKEAGAWLGEKASRLKLLADD